MITLVGENRLRQGGRSGSCSGWGAAGSDAGSSWESGVLTTLRKNAESVQEREKDTKNRKAKATDVEERAQHSPNQRRWKTISYNQIVGPSPYHLRTQPEVSWGEGGGMIRDLRGSMAPSPQAKFRPWLALLPECLPSFLCCSVWTWHPWLSEWLSGLPQCPVPSRWLLHHPDRSAEPRK